MANSEGTFGGNGSVCWRVDVLNAKGNPKSQKKNANGWEQEGHDGTPAVADFTITLRRPTDQTEVDALVRDLRAAATKLEDKEPEGAFNLRIESNQHKQIQIKWPSVEGKFVPTTISTV